MLTEGDIAFIKGIREEVRTNRTQLIVVTGNNEVGKHPVTGQPIYEEYTHEVPAVVTEVSVRTAVDRYIDQGIEIRTGDIIVDISIGDVPDDIDSERIEHLHVRGIRYQTVAADELGLGGVNRLEVVGRRIT